jgi:hypothetical protein
MFSARCVQQLHYETTQLLGYVFSVRSVPRCYKLFKSRVYLVTHVEAGSNTSTVTLRVVGGDEKGSLKSETVKYDRESQGTRTPERLRWRGPEQKTRSFSRHRGCPTKKTVTVKRMVIRGHEPQPKQQLLELNAV